MSVWDTYQARLDVKGGAPRTVALTREQQKLNRKLTSSLSYQSVLLDGKKRNLTIINSDSLDTKKILTLPGETILCGSLIEWADNYWLVTTLDPGHEVYTRATMQQCNYLLRWVDIEEEVVVERWCIVADGTKYLIGETLGRGAGNGLALGDTRMFVSFARDEYTVKLGRKNRLIIDDYDAPTPIGYRITKPFKIGGVYNEQGVMSFIVTEENTTDDDNLELHIADYYKYFPKYLLSEPEETPGYGKEVWF